MLSIFMFLLGIVVASVVLTALHKADKQKALRAHEGHYKRLWEEAVHMLDGEGRITDEQLLRILPPAPPSSTRLTRGWVSEDDRAKIEILRAEKGLLPLDNLDGMGSYYRREVREARIKHGTET